MFLLQHFNHFYGWFFFFCATNDHPFIEKIHFAIYIDNLLVGKFSTFMMDLSVKNSYFWRIFT